MPYFVYIVRCKDNSLYIGSTRNITQRVQDYNNGKGAFTTRKKLPVKLVCSQKFETKSAVLKREKQLKGWSRVKKEALIKGDLKKLKQLSKREK